MGIVGKKSLLWVIMLSLPTLLMLTQLAAAQNGTAICARGQGYWKNHPGSWPVDTLTLGGESYSQDELIGLLRTPPRGDASVVLARQLIAASLNVASGIEAGTVESAVGEADGLLAGFEGRLPLEVRTATVNGQSMLALSVTLDTFNNALMVEGCDDEASVRGDERGNCENGPPSWAPAHGWRQRCGEGGGDEIRGRSRGNCQNAPPSWARANGWRRRCQGRSEGSASESSGSRS